MSDIEQIEAGTVQHAHFLPEGYRGMESGGAFSASFCRFPGTCGTERCTLILPRRVEDKAMVWELECLGWWLPWGVT